MRIPLFVGVYWALALLLYIVAIPLLLILSIKPKYRHSLPARFFLFNNPRPKDCDIWLHACSLGEVKSLEPLIKRLESERIMLTVITATGFLEAKRLFPQCHVAFLPFEIFLPFWVRNVHTLVVSEAELWYMLFFTARLKGAKNLLINARISERSLPKYMRFRYFYHALFKLIDEVFAQRDEDCKRLKFLGAKSVNTMGNLKLLNQPVITKELSKPAKKLVVIASTHDGEEEIVLEALKTLSNDYVLALVPRHPERFLRVFEIAKQWGKESNKSVALYSSLPKLEWTSDLLVVDAMGELINLYSIADCVILCGSFLPIGGHNPLEPAHFGCKIISGIHIFNQFALFENIEGYSLIEVSELSNTIAKINNLPRSFIKGEFDPQAILKQILHYKGNR